MNARLLVLPAVFVLTTSCAVLNIEVDVYKGPLANHEQVLMQQTLVMATSAKPILVDLRDTMQWGNEDNVKKERIHTRDRGWYRPDHIGEYSHAVKRCRERLRPLESSEQKSHCYFDQDEARSIDNILGLYKDLLSIDVSSYRRQVRDALDDYDASLHVLEVNKNIDLQRWARFAGAMKNYYAAEQAKFECLEIAYHGFLAPTELSDKPTGKCRQTMGDSAKRDWRQSKKIHESYINAINSLRAEKQPREVFSRVIEPQDDSYNAIFDYLAREGNVRGHAELLFGPDHEITEDRKVVKYEFIKDVVAIGKAFHSSRYALRRAWLATVHFYDLVTDEVVYTRHQRENLAKALAYILSQLTQTRTLAITLAYYSDHGDSHERILAAKLAGLLPALDTDFLFADASKWQEDTRPRGAQSLKTRLGLETPESPIPVNEAHQAHQIVELLLDVDALAMKMELGIKNLIGPPLPIDKFVKDPNDYFRYQPKGSRQYGLVRGPWEESDKWLELDALHAKLSQVQEEGAGALDRGRLERGIETLTEEYLNLVNKGSKNEQEAARLKLLDSLAQFAQNILTTANTYPLRKPRRSQGVLGGAQYILSHALVGDAENWLDPFDILDSRKEKLDDKKDEYIRVLQAIGNSILVQVDELRHQQKSPDRIALKKETEIAAIRQAWKREPRQVIQDLLGKLGSAVKSREEILKDIDKKIAELGKQDSEAKAQSDSAVETRERLQKDYNAAKIENDTLRKNYGRVDAAYDLMTTEEGLKKHVVKPGVARAQELIADVDSWITVELAKYVRPISHPRADTLLRAQDFLRELRSSYPSTEANERSALYDGIAAFLRLNKERGNDQIRNEEMTLRQMSQALEDVNRDVRRLADGQQEIKKKIDEETDRKNPINANLAALQVTTQVVIDKAPIVLSNSAASAASVQPSQVFGDLLDRVRTDFNATAERTTPEARRLHTAMDVLPAYPPSPTPVDPDSLKHIDSRDVLDQIIALLRHQEIVAKREANDPNVIDNIDAALQAALQHRAAMIHIRPSSAYLRNSYPTTSLQDDPGLTWDNLLAKQAYRSLPFYPQIRDLLDPRGKRNARITGEIDKQFWQNINRVRLAGSGANNYVVAKDDVGNWYVKKYMTDAEMIYKSALNLGLFSLGASEKVNLLQKAKAQRSGDTTKEVDAQNQTSLERAFVKYQNEYTKRTIEEFDVLRADLEKKSLHETIRAKWSNDAALELYRADLITQLEGARKDLDDARDILLHDVTDTNKGVRIISAAHEIKRYHRNLISRVKNLHLSQEPAREVSNALRNLDARKSELIAAADLLSHARVTGNETEAETKHRAAQLAWQSADKAAAEKQEALAKARQAQANAETAVTEAVEAVLSRLVKQRSEAVRDLESALSIIGEASKPPSK